MGGNQYVYLLEEELAKERGFKYVGRENSHQTSPQIWKNWDFFHWRVEYLVFLVFNPGPTFTLSYELAW